ncbi:MAG: PA0069 family radical SAM protein [Gammaproteobacteria bacterium]|nr:PA0069 family radical SAM protein [Gammaproteobacteria bacterium]
MPKSSLYKGRGASHSPDNRYSDVQRENIDDGWHQGEQAVKLKTQLFIDNAKKIITYNSSPDVPFDRSINPYKGCEHGCVYCFARPTHAWLDLSPGIDFETKIFHKPNAPELLKKELSHKNYKPAPISLGINTDAYQPAERKLGLTRQCLEILVEHKHPVVIVTKSALIERDIDLLVEAAEQQLLRVVVSVTTLDAKLNKHMEPRTAAPHRRLETIGKLSDAGVPVNVLMAPIIPVLNDSEIENLLTETRKAGARNAGYVMLRLPHELDEIFMDWLSVYEPLKAEHIMNRIRDLRGGKTYDSGFGKRMRGEGVFAELIAKRFKLAKQRLAFPGNQALRCDLFTPPPQNGQLNLL